MNKRHSIKNKSIPWNYYFYGRSISGVPYEEVDDDSDAIDLESLPQEVQNELQSSMPHFYMTAPEPEQVEFEELPTDIDYAPSMPMFMIGISPMYKRLFGFRIPEFKVDLCKKTFKTPFGKVKFSYPCLKTRESDLSVYAYLFFPTYMEQFIKDELKRCFNIASATATSAGTAVFWATPGTPFERVLAAVPTTVQTFESSILSCLKSIPSWETVSRNVKYGVKYEQIKINDWH